MSSEEIVDLRKASDGAVNLSQCDIIKEDAELSPRWRKP